MLDRVPAGLECLRCSSRRRYTLRHVETLGRIGVRKVAVEEAIETFRRLVVDRVATPDLAAVDHVAVVLVAAVDHAAVADRVVITDPTAVAMAASSNLRR